MAGSSFDGGRMGAAAPGGAGAGGAGAGAGSSVDDFDRQWAKEASSAGTPKPPELAQAKGKDVSQWRKLMQTAKNLIIATLALILLAVWCIRMMRASMANPTAFAYFKAIGLAACFAGLGLSIAVAAIGGKIMAMGQKPQGLILILTGGFMATIIAGLKVGMIPALLAGVLGSATSAGKSEKTAQGGAGKEAEQAGAQLQHPQGGK